VRHELDAVAESVVETCRQGSKSVKAQILNDLIPRVAGVPCVFEQRAATITVRSRSVAPLCRALVVMGMADAKLDDAKPRDKPLQAMNLHATGSSDTFLYI
jgi:hypothetical protein